MKHAFITGGQGYLGSAIAGELRSRGWEVVAPSFEECDVTNKESILRLLNTLPPLGAVIHCAAMPLERIPLAEVSPSSFAQTVAVAAGGTHALAQAALGHLAPGAAFVGITTKAIEGVTDNVGAYVPGKLAMRGVLRVLDTESYPARVYAVAPGFLPGGLNSDLPAKMLEILAPKSETPQAIARLVADLCEDTSSQPGSYTLPRVRSDL